MLQLRKALPPPLTNASLAGLVLLNAPALASDWTHFAASPQRLAITDAAPGRLDVVRWVLSEDGGAPIAFNGQAGVVVEGGRFFATGRIGGQSYLIAGDAASGEVLWKAPLPAPHLESWSTPAVCGQHGMVVVASGRYVTAFDTATGDQRWQTQLERNIVNASPLITSDMQGANRIFITDYDGFGGAGRLYCINIDPFDAVINPAAPGDIVWMVTIGPTSGNTPAYRDRTVYISSISDPTGISAGRVQAFPADALSTPEPLWTFTNPAMHGFYSGIAVRSEGASITLYAASYALYGGQFAANLVKIDGATGQLTWSVPANRTDATPIPLEDGRIIIAGGIHGFGSAPSVQLFQDHGTSAALHWDSALDSWRDLNTNGIMDPGEYLVMGGWTHQPVALQGGAGLIVGAIAPQTFSPCTDLYLIDLDRHPQDPLFIRSHLAGAGSTPAAAENAILTIGAAGLHAIGPLTCYANCDGSTTIPVLNVDDFTCFINSFAGATSLPHEEQILHYANCDQSTTNPILNVDDFTCFINQFAAGGCR